MKSHRWRARAGRSAASALPGGQERERMEETACALGLAHQTRRWYLICGGGDHAVLLYIKETPHDPPDERTVENQRKSKVFYISSRKSVKV